MGCCLDPVVLGSAVTGTGCGQQTVSQTFLCKKGSLAFVFAIGWLQCVLLDRGYELGRRQQDVRGAYTEFAKLLSSELKHCLALLTVWLQTAETAKCALANV